MGLTNQSALSTKSITKQDNNDDANSSTTDAGIVIGAENVESPEQPMLTQPTQPTTIIVKINEKNGW